MLEMSVEIRRLSYCPARIHRPAYACLQGFMSGYFNVPAGAGIASPGLPARRSRERRDDALNLTFDPRERHGEIYVAAREEVLG